MPRKKQEPEQGAVIENAGLVLDQPITETLEKNYMPYAMSVIVSRAIPEIDGFKPSHRKLLYTMYKMGLLGGARTKSANIVGQTMRLNPHGDAAIYETMVRLTRGNEALLHPYVDSKGNFGKTYSRDMAYAAARYTEAKLAPIARELFEEIDSDTVDFVDNYDSTMQEPTLFPVRYPSVLVNANMGIAVGMASSICSFNLGEVCETAAALLKDPEHDILDTLKAPDFSGGGYLVYREEEIRRILETGRGSVKVRCRYSYDKANDCIDITEIPPTTTVEAIMDKVVDLMKAGKLREISDMRDETDLSGLKLTIDLRRGVDPDRLMQRLLKLTPLEDSFSCNFNVLVGGAPRVMGVGELLEEWTAFRQECVRRRVAYELDKKKQKLHLLLGLSKILLDIDKAIKIVRETAQESEVVPNLMIGFGIDKIQAEYVAELRLRNLNREHILRRLEELDQLKSQIAGLEKTLSDPKKIKAIIISELEEVVKKYGQPRKTLLYYPSNEDADEIIDEAPDYPVHLFFTREGYFKKITPQSLRMSGEQKVKEGDVVAQEVVATNNAQLLFFTDKQQVYKASASDFTDGKASAMGDYIPAKLGTDEGESALFMAVTKDFAGHMLFFFENGKAAKVELSSYATKTKRKKLLAAYSDKSPAVAIFQTLQDGEFLMRTNNERVLIVHCGAISTKTTKNTQGVQLLSLRKNVVKSVQPYKEEMLENSHRFRTKTLPSTGSFLKANDLGEQLIL
ncbi:MAG: DNA topoisomerase (ATP-hydrolyzing) subunit A [Oscillospiraceae bacterium]|nr:DNA topoisomerase (ATP-hydrolyzing) subunit A [Oscillospiraceae bacterium]